MIAWALRYFVLSVELFASLAFATAVARVGSAPSSSVKRAGRPWTRRPVLSEYSIARLVVGVRLLNLTTGDTPARLQVQASGPWSITISNANTAPVAMAPGHFDGIGDQVVIMRGKASTGRFHNTGDANFVVNSYSTTNRELLVNEIGAFDGTEIIPSGTILFEVQSNGGWSIDLS